MSINCKPALFLRESCFLVISLLNGILKGEKKYNAIFMPQYLIN